ncbi:MAG: hypothetical protein OEY51_05935, partial [Cyclobacteriaceae bacterium]|nr:hypothetical protein [Cyclobacteriaceae bacterium]
SSLYIMGKMEASQAISTSGVTERDNQYIVRSENVKIHLAVGKETYTYIVNPKGALLDTKDITTYGVAGAVSWNSTATAAAKPHENGWQFELEIPLEELNIGGQKTTINFSRRDAEKNSEYEYVRTFGRSGLDHQIPMYQADWNAVDMFAELILK